MTRSFCRLDGEDGGKAVGDGEFDLVGSVAHTVDAAILVVVGTGIGGKQGNEGGGKVGRDGEAVGETHGKRIGQTVGGETARGILYPVHLRQVGLDVVDGGAVHHIHALDQKFDAVVGAQNVHQTQYAQPYGIGTMGTARGEYTHAAIAAQTRGTNGGRKRVGVEAVEAPQHPYMRIALQPAEGVGRIVRGQKHDAPPKRNETALAGDAEFVGEIGADVGDDFHRIGMLHS